MEPAEIESDYRKIQQQYRVAAVAALTVLGIGTVYYHIVEHFRWLDSVYFCTVTLTSIGYGDLVPKTDAGKLFTIFYALVGIGIIAFFANLLLKNAVIKRELRRAKRRQG